MVERNRKYRSVPGYGWAFLRESLTFYNFLIVKWAIPATRGRLSILGGEFIMSPIQTKAQAAAAGRLTYNTGKACRNGHFSDRYTSCGACIQCLRDAQSGIRRENTGRPARTPERMAALEQLGQVKFRTYQQGVGGLLDAAIGLTLARFPVLDADDVVATRQGVKPLAGTLLYFANVHHEDTPALKDIERAINTQYGPDIEAERRRILGNIAAQANAARDNGETEWKFT